MMRFTCARCLLTIALPIVVLLAGCQRHDDAAGGVDSDVLSTPSTPSTASTDRAVPAIAACAELAFNVPAHTTVSVAEVIAAGTFVAPGPDPFGPPPDFSDLPDFCRIAGSIAPAPDSDIRFELWLPVEGWNGRFLQTGNGGAAGSIVYGSLVSPLARGYAVAHTDTGHQGGGGEFTWAPGHPEKLIDYQYRAVREVTLAGKVITAAYYGRAPAKSYWLGCSTGGRQGLKEAQRFPEDYDAIVAGAPASNWSRLASLSVQIERNLGPDALRVENLDVLRNAAIASCDAMDGVTDRVIADPDSCNFDPAATLCADGRRVGCLTPTEVAAARRIYAGLVDSSGATLFPGTGPGSETGWAAFASPGFRIGSSYYRNVLGKDADWDLASFDVNRDLALAEDFDAGAARAMDPDLSGFIDRGGKLLVYHGTTDGLIPYGNSVAYHESVQQALGADAIADSVRLFLVPGMNHCAGGEGTYAVDWLGAMEQWVDGGEAPDRLLAAHPADASGNGGFTRPLCAYPQVARYAGDDDVASASSFACVVP